MESNTSINMAGVAEYHSQLEPILIPLYFMQNQAAQFYFEILVKRCEI